jgi:hypothetical protein
MIVVTLLLSVHGASSTVLGCPRLLRDVRSPSVLQARQQIAWVCTSTYSAVGAIEIQPHIIQHACAGEYCSYTDACFSAGRGIAVITTAEIIGNLLSRAYHGQDTVINTTVSLFEERETSGKGIGLLGKRDMKRGDLILSEQPSLLVHLDAVAGTAEIERLGMQRAAVTALPPKTSAQILALMGKGGEDDMEAKL